MHDTSWLHLARVNLPCGFLDTEEASKTRMTDPQVSLHVRGDMLEQEFPFHPSLWLPAFPAPLKTVYTLRQENCLYAEEGKHLAMGAENTKTVFWHMLQRVRQAGGG